MSVETIPLDDISMGLMSTDGIDIALEYGFRRNANDQELQTFIQRLATNGGDVLSAIIDAASAEIHTP